MSHALGEVWSMDGRLLGFFDYSGTVDVCCSAILPTRDDVINYRRTDKAWRYCSQYCENEVTPAILYNDYGYGSYWNGEVCLKCGVIKGPLQPPDENVKDGHPFLNQRMLYYFKEILPCPKCGQKELQSDGYINEIKCAKCGSYMSFHQLVQSVIT